MEKSTSSRCIFGPPDLPETQQFLDNEANYDRLCLEENYTVIIENHNNNKVLEDVQENLNWTKSRPQLLKRCLFGVPSQHELDDLMQQQQNYDYQRIKDLYGFDLIEIEHFEQLRMRTILKTKKKKKKKTKSILLKRDSSKRKRLFCDNNNQTRITDFYHENKLLSTTAEK